MKISLIITAAGSGQRFGSPQSKVLVPLLGKPIIAHTLEQFSNVIQISHCVITANAGQNWHQICNFKVNVLS